MLGLDYLLGPHSADEFLDVYHGRKALLIEGEDDRFEQLFGWDDVNHTINFGQLNHPQVKLVQETKPLPAEALNRIDHWLREGATLIMNQIHTRDPVIERFVRSLGKDLNTGIGVNAYVSWPAKQGFDIHYDTHDVFVIQVAGEKEWKVFEPTLKHPIEQFRGPQGDPPDGEPYLSVTLTPGDVLYIPRGHWHYALSVTPSIHLTTGPQARTGIDFLLWQLEHLFKNDEFLRRDFPIALAAEFGGPRSSEALQQHLEEFKQVVRRSIEDESLWQLLKQFVMARNAIPRHYELPEFVTTGQNLTPETRFVLREEQKALIEHDDDRGVSRVLIRGYIVYIDGIPPEALRTLFTPGTGYSGAALMEMFPEIEWKTLQRALQTLFNYGALQLEV